MALTYTEALLFARAGDDMRRADWPAESFIRWSVGEPKDIPGLSKEPFSPTTADQATNDWRRA